MPLRVSLETPVGNFALRRETHAYLGACCDLVHTYVQKAQAAKSINVWEKALFYALEVQRLEALRPVEVRSVTPDSHQRALVEGSRL